MEDLDEEVDGDGLADACEDLDDDNDGKDDCWNFIYDPNDPWNLLSDDEKNIAIQNQECFDFELNNTLLPYSIEFLNSFPNPFNPSTTISFNIITPSIIDISIYDVNGHKVQELHQGFYNKGFHELIWTPNSAISSGIYFVSLKTKYSLINHKILYLK